MADNSTLSTNIGSGDVYASNDIAGVKYQRVKPSLGAAGTAVDMLPVVAGLDSTATGIAAAGLVAQLDDVATTTVTENQFAPVRLSTRRALLVEGVASGTAQPVSGTLASTVADGANVALGTTTDASTATTVIGRLQKLVALLPTALGANGGLKIEGVASGTVVPISGTVTASNTAGDVAHDGVNSGNPVQVGAVAISYGTNPTAVSTSLDRTQLYANMAGVLFTMGGHPNAITIELAFTAAQTDVAIVTVAGGAKIVVTRCTFVTSHANTVDVAVRVGFGAANTPTTTGVVLTHPNVAAGSGVVEGNGSGMLGVGADGEDLRITATVPTTGSARVLVTYFTTTS